MLSPIHHMVSLKGRSVLQPCVSPPSLSQHYFLMQIGALLPFSAHPSERDRIAALEPKCNLHNAGSLMASEAPGMYPGA